METVETVVIGAGQAGLATAQQLGVRGRECVVLDHNQRIGDNWRQQWDSLRLYTPARFDGLPGMRFPGASWSFPTKDDVAAYLEAYADRWDLPVRLGIRVEGLAPAADQRFVVTTDGGPILADNVVVATGTFGRKPSIPDCAKDLDPSILQLHSSEYRRPGQLRDGPVLVVGASHSGTDIAYELAATRPTTLVGRDCGEVPIRLESRLFPVAFAILLFAWQHAITRGTPMGRKEMAEVRFHGGPMLRVKRADLAERGVIRDEARVAGVRDGLPLLAGGGGGGGGQRDLGNRLPPELRLGRPAHSGRRRVAAGVPGGSRRRARPVLLWALVPVRVQLDAVGRCRPRRGARR